MLKILLVALGGVIGAVSRYGLSILVYRLSGQYWFPFGTLAVNVLGCLAIGILMGLAESRGAFTPEVRVFLIIGVLGSFTTFSTFGYESMEMLRNGLALSAILNVLLQIILGLGAVWIGFLIAESL